MKKNIFAITAAAALVLNIAATSVTTFAATGDTDTQKGSNATVNLTSGTDGKGAGAIVLKQVPDIDFGSDVIKAGGNTFSSATISAPVIVDNAGVDSGWGVYLSVGEFKSGSDVLKGAKFSLGAGTATINNTVSAVAATKGFGTVKSDEKTGTFSTSDASVFYANDGSQGVGENTDAFDSSAATLYVPAGNVAGDYTATLTWTLGNAPASETPKSDGSTTANPA